MCKLLTQHNYQQIKNKWWNDLINPLVHIVHLKVTYMQKHLQEKKILFEYMDMLGDISFHFIYFHFISKKSTS